MSSVTNTAKPLRLNPLTSFLPLSACLGSFVLLTVPNLARGDIFLFRDGRVLSGSITEEKTAETDGQKSVTWVVRTRSGAFMQINPKELQLHGRKGLTDLEKAYVDEYKSVQPNTAEAHVKLAGWCLSKQLKDLAAAHYEAALDLDPDHRTARAAAGYENVDGRWVKEEVVMGEDRGKVRHGRRWRFPEEVAILEQKEQEEAAMADVKREWTVLNNKAAFLRTMSADLRQDAVNKIRLIQDPRAVSIFSKHLLSTKKRAPVNVRLAYVDLLRKFPAATSTLAHASVTDPEPSVRNACFDALRGVDKSFVTPVYMSYLGNSNNAIVNRAGEGLAQFGDESAVLPLIDHLVTVHEQARNSAGMNASPTNGSFSMGGPSSVKKPEQNGSVLNALNQITNQNYGYDKQQWTEWYARTHAKPVRDLRRDL